LVLRIQVSFWHKDLFGVIETVEIHVFSDQLCYKLVLLGKKTFAGFFVLPVQLTLSFVLWIIHFVLVINDFEDTASYLSSKLAKDAI
jgi:hypothetical protein